MNKFLIIVIILLQGLSVFSQRVKTPSVHAQSNIRFTENKNQWNPIISHKAQLDGGALFVEKTGKLTYHLYDKDNYRARHLGKALSPELKFHAYSVDFIGSNKVPVILSKEASEDYVNFFIGKNPANWASNVHQYKTISILELYNFIDVIYSGGSQSIKYNFIVKPHGNPDEIKLQYTGVKDIQLKNNDLHISTSVSESIEQKPFVFQIINGDTIEIPSKYVLDNNIVSFKLLKEYDHSKVLIIDPLLVFAAQSGSTADNFGMTATYDSRGSLYSGGTAFNVGYPTTIGAYDVTYNGNSADGFTDVVITKYDSSGTYLRYSTYLGGTTSSEIVTSLIVDKNDNLCLYGATGSSDFPTTVSCYDNTFNGGEFLNYPQNGTLFNSGTDVYVAKFNSIGTALIASTFLGGTKNDGVNNNINTSSYDSLMFNYGDQFRGEIQIDINDDIYVVSSTQSLDFPAVNAIDNSLNGNQDAILVKLNANLTSIIYSTFIGGNDKDCGNGIALDDSLNVYITGGTCSNDFFTTTGSYKPNYNGGKTDGYICKIKYDGSVIVNSTFIGTSSYDQSYFIQLDNNTDVYIFGQSQGVIPVTPGVFSKANSRQFIQKLNNSLDTLLASTVIGNGSSQINISPSAFSVDCAGNIYLSGWGASLFTSFGVTNMPITANAIQSTTDGHNFYIMVLGPNMGSLIFGSYFGGNQSMEHVDGGTSRFDKKGIIYQSVCAGCGGYDDFPVTPGAWPATPGDPNHNTDNNNCNNGVFKIDFQLNSAIANVSASTLSGCAPLTVTLTNNSTPGHSFLWDYGGNDTTSVVSNPVKTFTAAGTYTVHLYVKTSICTNLYDTASVVITVYNFAPTTLSNDTICPGFTSQLNASGGTSYTWSPASSLSNPNIQNPIASPSITTTYSVIIENNSTANFCSTTLSVTVIVGPKIDAAFNYSIGSCSNNVQFSDSSFVSPVAWEWNFGNTYTSTAQNPLHFYGSSNSYTVQLISTNVFGCKDTAQKVIILPAFSPVSVNPTVIKCSEESVQLLATGGITYAWQPSQTVSNSTIANPLAFPLTTTVYTVTITTLNGLDTCKSLLTTAVVVPTFSYNTSQIAVTPSTLILGQSSNVTLNGFPANNTITVVPNAQVLLNGDNTFVVTPTKSGTYTIYATDQNNCRIALTTIYVYVIADECNESVVYLPTGFTPNEDGVNDILFIHSNFITDVYLTIYDRWGEKLFETNDVNKGWDGTFKGKALDQGVYGYYMTFKCNNGQESFKKGNITLMR